MGRAAIRWAAESGRLERLFTGAYRVAGSPVRWEQLPTAACLAVEGAALSHQTAAHLWGFPDFRARTPVHLLLPRRSRVSLPASFVIHHSRHAFTPTKVRGLTVTSRARTLCDLAGEVEEATLEAALDAASQQTPFFEHELDEELKRFTGRGQAGAGVLRQLVALRGGVSTESPLETRVRRALRQSALPAPTLQFDVYDGERHVTRADFAWPAHRVALHVDSYTWHGNRKQFDLDAVQRSTLAKLDWQAIIVTSRTLESKEWLEHLGAVLKRRSPQLALALKG